MKLICPQVNMTFSIKPQMLNRIVVEHPGYYEAVVLALYRQIYEKEETCSCFWKEEPYAIHKYFELILSPLDLAFCKKEIQKKLYQYLIGELELQELAGKIAEGYGTLVELLEETAVLSEYPIVFREEFDLTDWLKQMDVQIKQPEGSFLERLLDYATTMTRLLDKRVFVLANCEAYFTVEDYAYLEQWLRYEDVYVILLSQQQNPLHLAENEVIIDRDLCEIHDEYQ